MNRFLRWAAASALSMALAACAPTVEFSADPTGGVQPLKVTFKDKSATLAPGRINMNSLAPVYGPEWDFGDGTGSTAEDPVHDYAVAGDYTVKLTVSNMFGTTTLSKPNFIKVNTPNSNPVAKFSFTVDTENNLKLSFKDDSTPGSRPITQWLWDFGDNATSAEQNPTHTYAKAGIYKVALRVTTVVGSDEEEKDVGVGQTGPTADFRFQLDSANTLTVIFTDESVAGTQPITAWAWDFGDNATSTEQNPRHTYAIGKEYNVKLKVTTKAGTDEVTIQVTPIAPAGGEGED